MNNEPKIPLLRDLLYRKQPTIKARESNSKQPVVTQGLQEEIPPITPIKTSTYSRKNGMEEEIRLIINKQMEIAYKKIIHLINERNL